MRSSLKQPLTNVQLELLKAFSHDLSEQELMELKQVLAKFFAQRLIQEADKVWAEKNWTDQEVDQLLNTTLLKKN
jgi:predicted metal-binding transcription factor (methanogenesis marker protein 9)